MDRRHNDRLLYFYNEAFAELYVINTIVQMTKKSCEDTEFSGQYYGIPEENTAKLSAERNNYINMLTLVTERISNVMQLKLSMEKEFTLQENADNCC